MELKVFSVYDSKVGAYLSPLFFRSTSEAIRAFSSTVQLTDSDFHKYASDYTLFELGRWDDTNASFFAHASPISLGVAVEFLSSVDRTIPQGVVA